MIAIDPFIEKFCFPARDIQNGKAIALRGAILAGNVTGLQWIWN